MALQTGFDWRRMRKHNPRRIRSICKPYCRILRTKSRLRYLLSELRDYSPDPKTAIDYPIEIYYLANLEYNRYVIRAALLDAKTALNDWIHIYANDFCDPMDVTESVNRVQSYGLVGYVAEIIDQCNTALQLISDKKT